MQIFRKLFGKSTTVTTVDLGRISQGSGSKIQYNSIQLGNGLMICSEKSESLKSEKSVKLAVKLGTKYEDSKTSGTLYRLKDIWQQKMDHLAGKDVARIEYDHEYIYFTINHITPQIQDSFKYLRLFLDFKLDREEFKIPIKRRLRSEKDLFLTTAFGYKTYGLPLEGLDTNHDEHGRQLHIKESQNFLKT